MGSETVILRMPGELYQRAKRTAETLEQPLEQVLIETLDTALPPEAELPAEIRSDLAVLATYNNDDLWLVSEWDDRRARIATRRFARVAERRHADGRTTGAIGRCAYGIQPGVVAKSARICSARPARQRVIGRSACGRATVAALHLNNVILVEARRLWAKAGWHPPED
ncbi:MAG: hypothetical protein HY327_04045 [Chloroflexi bacterium]|nr:hypothetical protein [Chloroflexota bacterium]